MTDVQLGIFNTSTCHGLRPGSPKPHASPTLAKPLGASASQPNLAALRQGLINDGTLSPSLGILSLSQKHQLLVSPPEAKLAKASEALLADTGSMSPVSRVLAQVTPLRLPTSPNRPKDLSPSTAPTPCVSARDRPGSSAGAIPAVRSGLRLATISVPSAGVANDAARARNCGRPLGLRIQGKSQPCMIDLSKELLNVGSAPTLLTKSTDSIHTLNGDHPLAPKTPRMARGLVRRVSKVLMHYPSCPSLSFPPEKAIDVSPPRIPVDDLAHEKAPLRSTSTKKRVSWADHAGNPIEPIDPMSIETRTKLHSSYIKEDGKITFALHRSARKIDALHDIRRVSRPSESRIGEEDSESKPPSRPVSQPIPGDGEVPQDEDAEEIAAGDSAELASPSAQQAAEEQEGLMGSTLGNLNDCEADLRYFEILLAEGLKVTESCGATRHATAVMSMRTLAVVRRKADLLHDVEDRAAGLKAVHDRRDEVLKTVVDNSGPAPEELGGITKFLAAYTSQVNPADANKSNFASFAATFKLPAAHQQLLDLKKLADEVGEWWADACLDQAEKGHGHSVLHRLFEVALGTGVAADHPKLFRAKKIINDRLAEAVLQEAQERQANDMEEAGEMAVPKVGPAAKAADIVEQEILKAVKEGVPAKDDRLKEAERIVKTLREVDGQRKRLAGRQKRLEAEGKA